jgi:hypothetical protein
MLRSTYPTIRQGLWKIRCARKLVQQKRAELRLLFEIKKRGQMLNDLFAYKGEITAVYNVHKSFKQLLAEEEQLGQALLRNPRRYLALPDWAKRKGLTLEEFREIDYGSKQWKERRKERLEKIKENNAKKNAKKGEC